MKKVQIPKTPPPRNSASAFSLVEVALAISIIAIAFTVLIGMLPAGMRSFQDANDANNEFRITANMTAILQAAEFEQLKNNSFSQQIYFFDAEGAYLGYTGGTGGNLSSNEDARVYMGRIIVDDQNVPSGKPPASGEQYSRNVAIKGLLIIARHGVASLADDRKTALLDITEAHISDPSTLSPQQKALKFRVMPITIAKMDGINN